MFNTICHLPQTDLSVHDQINCICDHNAARGSFIGSFSGDSSASSRSPSITGLPHLNRVSNVNRTQFPRPALQKINQAAIGVRTARSDAQTSLDVENLELIGCTQQSYPNRSDESQLQNASHLVHCSDACFCGPGRKRYLIAFLCCACLTIVIGMRSEMLGIITNLNNTNPSGSVVNRLSGSNEHIHGAPASKPEDDLLDPAGVEGHLPGEEIDTLHDVSGLQPEMNQPATSLIFKPSEHRQMPWTKTIKNDIAENAVFFAYLITSPIGGYLTVNHDSSFLLGCSVAMTCGMNLFLPLVETIGNNVQAKFIMVVLLRLLQGLAEGCLIPAVFGVLRFWSPETERSTLVCVAVIGVSLGPLIGLPVCAEIEKKWGWGVVFYIYANLGLIWCIFWWRLIDEKPAKDERLGKRERAYLHASVARRILCAKRQIPIPWQSIFRSRPIFAIFFTYAADDWTFQISSVCMQSFYQQLYKVDVERTIFFLSFPFLSRSMFVPIGGIFADFLRIKTSLSLTTIRKIFAGLGFGLKGIFFVALGFAPTEIYATVLLSLSLGFSGLAVAGYAVNVIDLAPNFSGLVMGFANSVSTFTGILSTLTASIVVHKFGLELKNGWRVALALAALSQFCAMLIYLIFGSSEEQSWAYTDRESEEETTPIHGETKLCDRR
ncbi:unnamed protein product [Echinostoma caproni]|uniref:MFS domain-containing protein n=1 Tax=Echinostoma caproni TaxID=27848 RepID=A0A183A8I9_9TREM|nr:unnamed protein product [Echinostoma caproni]